MLLSTQTPSPLLLPQSISPQGTRSRAAGEAVGPGSLTEPHCSALISPSSAEAPSPPPPRTCFLACLSGESSRQKSEASLVQLHPLWASGSSRGLGVGLPTGQRGSWLLLSGSLSPLSTVGL